jgi:hypothetical protein
MPQIIEVPGYGDVEFPDGMTDDQISSAIQQNMMQAQPQSAPQEPQRTFPQELGRQAGLTGRYIAEAGAGLADVVGAPVRAALNVALPESMQIPTVSDVAGRRLNLPTPETTTERLVGDASRALASTGMTMGLAGATQPISQAGQAIRSALTSNAGTQAASAIGGGAGVGIARESGGGTGAQIAGGLAGSLLGASMFKPTSIGKSVQELQNAGRDKVLKEAQKQGYVALPSDVGAGKIPRALETVSGKFKAEELASAKNQQVTNNLARKYLGVSNETPLTSNTLDTLIDDANQVYRQASSLPSTQIQAVKNGMIKSTATRTGGEIVNDLKLARDDSRSAWKAFNFGSDKPTIARNAANAADTRVSQLENELETLAKQNNQPELLNQLKQARTEIAKVYTVEKATNPVTGSVDARAIARQINRKSPITGELQLIGKFAKAFPKVTKPVAEQPNPFSIYDVIGTSVGVGALNPYLTALPAARVAGRYGVLSQPVQQKFVQPQYNQITKPFVPYQGLLNTEK